jgi:hypothetical protein
MGRVWVRAKEMLGFYYILGRKGLTDSMMTLPSYDNDAKTQGSRELQARP